MVDGTGQLHYSMGVDTSLFDYDLPAALIAQHPPEQRGASRMMVVAVGRGEAEHRAFSELPGMLMPDLYFQYVRSRDARHIHKAFSHNAHDIVSMAAVMVKMLNFSANPLNTSEHPAHDVYAYGRIAENSERFDDAITAYRKSLEAGLFAPARTDAIVRLSMILKRTDRWKEALKLWEQLKDTSHSHDIFPYEEIAKYCEHQLKDYNAALKVVNDALKQLDFTEYMGECRQQSLLHRKRRLEARRDGRSWRFKKNERSD